MASLVKLTPFPLLSTSGPCSFPAKTPTWHPIPHTLGINYRQIAQSSKFDSFLDLEPKSKPESLNFDIPWFNQADRSKFDVIVIGAGPAGLRLAEQVSRRGIKVCCLDPSLLSMWPNNYGVWVDEFESLGLEDCLDAKWPMTCVHMDDRKTKYLDRAYGRVNRKDLKLRLLSDCASHGVRFHTAKVWKVNHEEFESSVLCDDGTELRASLIVDASGFTSTFTEYDKPRNPGFQIAHGILAEVDEHPFDLDKMVLMDWRDSHLGNEPQLRASNSKFPTFLYAMPFDSKLVFLEETSLVSRPVLSYAEVKSRMVARLRQLGIRVRAVIEDEKCLIPMGGPLPRMPQSVMAIGGNSGVVHPATGYTVAQTMALAPLVARAIAECLGSTRMIRGAALYQKAWDGLWPLERRCQREFYNFGMETLLKLDLNGTRSFFDAFFELDPHLWHGFLSSRLSLGELVTLGLSLFGHASAPTKLDMVTKCPVPMAKMEWERDHFSQFITEGFTSYCKRKRTDKVYGNNVEIQALSEMYNRPIHIHSCSTEPINIFHGNYNTDTPPIRLSYHHGNHYNSLVDPRRLTIGSGLGFGSLSIYSMEITVYEHYFICLVLQTSHPRHIWC